MSAALSTWNKEHTNSMHLPPSMVIRYLDRVVVKDDGYEVIFKAGVTVEVEI